MSTEYVGTVDRYFAGFEPSRVAHARTMRDECMRLARDCETSCAVVYVSMARTWSHRALSALQFERAAHACELAYARERSAA